MDEELETGHGPEWMQDSTDTLQSLPPPSELSHTGLVPRLIDQPSRSLSYLSQLFLRQSNKSEASTMQTEPEFDILDWSSNDDQRNPYNWSERRKWTTAGLMLFGTFVLPLNGTAITIAANEISAEFHITVTSIFSNFLWIIFSWNMGGAFFALFLPLLEDFGVRGPYMGFYTLFIAMVIAQALAPNFATLVITRFISGGCVSVLANTIAGAVPDLWKEGEATSIPIGLYIVLYVVGNTFGPVAFAPVMQYIGNWRWVFYIQLIIYGALYPVYLVLLPETRGHTILGKQAKQIRKETGKLVYTQQQRAALRAPIKDRLYNSVTRPLKLLVTEPVLLASTMWSAYAFGLVFAFTQSTEQVFTELYGWNSFQCGYVQAAIVIGELLGWPLSIYGTRLYFKSARRNRENPGEPIPEARLYVSVPGSLMICAGMFVYGWTSYSFLPWYAPAIGLAMVGFGVQIVVCTIADYVVDLYGPSTFASSAIAAVVVGEQVVAAALPLAQASLYTNLGFQWASSLLGFLGLLLCFIPVVFFWQGTNLRAKSPFMKSNGAVNCEK